MSILGLRNVANTRNVYTVPNYRHFSNLSARTLQQAWKCSLKSMDVLHSELSDELNETLTGEETGDEIRAAKRRKCNILKMTVYVFCSLVERFEEQDSKKSSAAELQKSGPSRGKKTNRVRDDSSNDWEKSRDKAIAYLTKISVMSIHRLFTPPVVDEEFVKIITKVCYKIMESSSYSKNTQLKHDIFQILATAVSRHKHSLGFCLKVIQLLQQKDSLVKDLAALVELIITTHEYTAIIRELICEVDRVDMSRESAGTKAISEFLKEVAEKCPSNILPSIPTFMDFLDRDAYMIRSATLAIFGALISKELSADDADLEKKTLRDDLLDKLEDHICDTTTFTRGQAIKVWQRLWTEGKVPIERQGSLVEAIVARLQDKSVYVRKQAVIFLTQCLRMNPFGPKLPIGRLQKALAKEKVNLDKMIRDSENEQQEEVDEDTNSTPWEAHQQNLIEFWMNRSSQDDDEDSNDSQNRSSPAEVILSQVQRLISSGEYRDTFKLVQLFKEKYPDHEIFNEQSEPDVRVCNSRSSQVDIPPPPVVQLAKKIYHFKIKSKKNTFEGSAKNVRKIERVAKGIIFQDDSEDSNDSSNDRTIVDDPRQLIGDSVPRQQMLVKFLDECVKFSTQIAAAIPLVCSLLHSATVSDSQEAIDFFVTAHQFGVQGSIYGIRKMIVLVFSRDKSVKDAVIAAYKKLYIEPVQTVNMSSRNRAMSVVNSLIELVHGATVGEMISLEELLKELMTSNDIDDQHTKILFEKYSQKIPGTTDVESRISIQLISMLATSNYRLIRANIEILIAVGLSEKAADDFKMVEQTCYALQRAVIPSIKVEEKEPVFRIPKDHVMFQRFRHILMSGIVKEDDDSWLSMANEIVKTIYKLAENPDSIVEDLVIDFIQELLPRDLSSESLKENEESNNQMEGDAGDEANMTKTPPEVSTEILARFVAFVGDLALYHLIHLESSVLTEVKIRRLMTEEKKRRKSGKTPGRSKSAAKGVTPGTNLEEEIGLAGASAMDDEIETFKINRLIDEPNFLLARLSPIILSITMRPGQYPDERLQRAASLTIAKFMACSQSYCEKYIRLLFTILEKSEDPIIRENTIIGLGDLCVRYPNLLDSWTEKLYAPLNDVDVNVRTSSLKVLSRLILSDMLKVKGQISELAKMLVDDNENLSSLAKLFFNELKKKENAIYNVLPDIISNLSGGEEMLEHKFQEIMKFLFSLIEKDRQTQCLVEKLCQRFRTTV